MNGMVGKAEKSCHCKSESMMTRAQSDSGSQQDSSTAQLINGYTFDSVTDRLARTHKWKSIRLNLFDPKPRGIHWRKLELVYQAHKEKNNQCNVTA